MKLAPLVLLLAGCTKPDCAALKTEADISIKAAEICTGTMVGCRLDYADVRHVVEHKHKADTCR